MEVSAQDMLPVLAYWIRLKTFRQVQAVLHTWELYLDMIKYHSYQSKLESVCMVMLWGLQFLYFPFSAMRNFPCFSRENWSWMSAYAFEKIWLFKCESLLLVPDCSEGRELCTEVQWLLVCVYWLLKSPQELKISKYICLEWWLAHVNVRIS